MPQQDLPFDKSQYAERVRAIEQLTEADTKLTAGQLRCVRRFLKYIFKHRRSAYDGTITFVRTEKPSRGQFSIAADSDLSKRSVESRLQWATSAGLIDTTVDCDSDGSRRTTLSIRWFYILKLGKPVASTVTPDLPPLVASDQSAGNAKQSAGSANQSAGSANQSAGDALSHSTNSQIPTTTTASSAAVGIMGEYTQLLQSCHVARSVDVAAELVAAAVPVADVRKACDEYTFNRKLFDGPGALVSRLRSGIWPVEGVVEADEARRRTAVRAERDTAQRWANKLDAIVKSCRKAGMQNDDEIRIRICQQIPKPYCDRW